LTRRAVKNKLLSPSQLLLLLEVLVESLKLIIFLDIINKLDNGVNILIEEFCFL
jgi:hypothetical protein